MARSAVIILDHGKVALIRRVRAGLTYYVFPGGGIENGETPEAAAIREAHEELGLIVELEQLFAVVHFGVSEQYFYLAYVIRGEFGTGTGTELASDADAVAGSYTPVWIALRDLSEHDIRPPELARLLVSQEDLANSLPIKIVEPR